jgi:Flp pilus assembly protein TadD
VNGVILFRQKDLKGSLQEFYNVTALNPHNASALYNVGVLCLSLGEKEKARLYLQKSLSLNPDNPNSQEIRKMIESIK